MYSLTYIVQTHKEKEKYFSNIEKPYRNQENKISISTCI